MSTRPGGKRRWAAAYAKGFAEGQQSMTHAASQRDVQTVADCQPRLSPDGRHYIHAHNCAYAIRNNLPREDAPGAVAETPAPQEHMAATGSPFVASLSPDQLRIHEALCDSQFIAGAKAGWNTGCIADPDAATAAFGALMKSRSGHLEGFADAKAALAAQQAHRDNVVRVLKELSDTYVSQLEEHDRAMQFGGYVPLDDDYPIEVPLRLCRLAYEATTEGSDRG